MAPAMARTCHRRLVPLWDRATPPLALALLAAPLGSARRVVLLSALLVAMTCGSCVRGAPCVDQYEGCLDPYPEGATTCPGFPRTCGNPNICRSWPTSQRFCQATCEYLAPGTGWPACELSSPPPRYAPHCTCTCSRREELEEGGVGFAKQSRWLNRIGPSSIILGVGRQ